ncbi:MAG: hypothetical protein K0R93_3452 [Anaerosolibacter sp.]|jgi:hypothetical protein|nr:hypothetical protein [Anaerosolibacter sp.]
MLHEIEIKDNFISTISKEYGHFLLYYLLFEIIVTKELFNCYYY